MHLDEMAVVTTAYRRPYYLSATLTAWGRAKTVQQLYRFVIALGRSDRYDAELDVIRACQPMFGVVPLEIMPDSPAAAASNGVHRALGEAASNIFSDPRVRFAVFGEEDIQVSDDVLLYMRWAAERFAGDPDVLAVCAHNIGGQGWDEHKPVNDVGADQETVRLLPYFNPWCWGTWPDRWAKFLQPNWDYECDSGSGSDSGYDWNIATRILPGYNLLCVVPDASRSQNIGRLEGWASNEWSFGFSQSQSFRERRGEVRYCLLP